jgi:hypothetical protein
MNGFDMIAYFLILFGVGSIIGITVASRFLGMSLILLSKINIAKYLKYVISNMTFVIGINIIFLVLLGSELILIKHVPKIYANSKLLFHN